mmetsp:Transcript_31601/g.51120  ORF Transcript_31601/g.51120 Transcript_31601/m.51120 type:complete len:211 (+) Transcript_31601:1002-1634(+)
MLTCWWQQMLLLAVLTCPTWRMSFNSTCHSPRQSSMRTCIGSGVQAVRAKVGARPVSLCPATNPRSATALCGSPSHRFSTKTARNFLAGLRSASRGEPSIHALRASGPPESARARLIGQAQTHKALLCRGSVRAGRRSGVVQMVRILKPRLNRRSRLTLSFPRATAAIGAPPQPLLLGVDPMRGCPRVWKHPLLQHSLLQVHRHSSNCSR